MPSIDKDINVSQTQNTTQQGQQHNNVNKAIAKFLTLEQREKLGTKINQSWKQRVEVNTNRMNMNENIVQAKNLIHSESNVNILKAQKSKLKVELQECKKKTTRASSVRAKNLCINTARKLMGKTNFKPINIKDLSNQSKTHDNYGKPIFKLKSKTRSDREKTETKRIKNNENISNLKSEIYSKKLTSIKNRFRKHISGNAPLPNGVRKDLKVLETRLQQMDQPKDNMSSILSNETKTNINDAIQKFDNSSLGLIMKNKDMNRILQAKFKEENSFENLNFLKLMTNTLKDPDQQLSLTRLIAIHDIFVAVGSEKEINVGSTCRSSLETSRQLLVDNPTNDNINTFINDMVNAMGVISTLSRTGAFTKVKSNPKVKRFIKENFVPTALPIPKTNLKLNNLNLKSINLSINNKPKTTSNDLNFNTNINFNIQPISNLKLQQFRNQNNTMNSKLNVSNTQNKDNLDVNSKTDIVSNLNVNNSENDDNLELNINITNVNDEQVNDILEINTQNEIDNDEMSERESIYVDVLNECNNNDGNVLYESNGNDNDINENSFNQFDDYEFNDDNDYNDDYNYNQTNDNDNFTNTNGIIQEDPQSVELEINNSNTFIDNQEQSISLKTGINTDIKPDTKVKSNDETAL